MTQIGLTPAQSEALRIVEDFGPLALKELGDMLVCDSGTSPSRLVERLVRAGLVHRETNELDRRQALLSTTMEGKRRAVLVRGIEEQMYAAIDGAVDQADARVLVRVLRAMAHGSPAGPALQKRLSAEQATSE